VSVAITLEIMRGKISFVWQLIRAGCDPNQILVMLALRRTLLGCRSVLDVGSGVSHTLRMMGVEHAVGAEGYLPSLEKARSQKTHHEYVQCDVRDISKHFQPGQFDGPTRGAVPGPGRATADKPVGHSSIGDGWPRGVRSSRLRQLMPFATAYLAETEAAPFPTALYAFVMLLPALVFDRLQSCARP